MLIPLSWLKEYVDIKLPFPKLAETLSAAGLTVEKWEEKDGDIIFDPEVTPNRPDWLSTYGIAREIAALTGSSPKTPKLPTPPKLLKSSLSLTIKPNYDLVPRITSVIIRNVTVKPSPDWLQKRIKQIGLRPINNLVDVTNYVLWTYGGLLHVFDYDKIRGHQMIIEPAKGGEPFRSLDGLDYTLPKGAIVIKDVGRVIDLLPLKGGENTAVSTQTKNVLLHSVVVDPVQTRRTSQALNLRSDSSAIAEKGLDPNGTLRCVLHALSLILDFAGGEVASEIIDHKATEFKPWIVEMSHSRLESVLGIKIDPKRVQKIFESLELTVSPKQGATLYRVQIPTFRNDLHLEEDLIEEVGRVYGYNNFPKTLPEAAVPTATVAYARNYDLEYKVKQTLAGFGYHEMYSYSLVAQDQIAKLGLDSTKSLRVDNPISIEFEYLRPHLLGNLLEALKTNLSNFSDVRFFELGKIFGGENVSNPAEQYSLCAILSGEKYFPAKGDVETILAKFGVKYEIVSPRSTDKTDWVHPGRNATIVANNQYLGFIAELHPTLLARFGIKGRAIAWVIKYDDFEKLANQTKKYQPIPKYPAVVEDLSLIIPDGVLYGDVVAAIQKISPLIQSIGLIDSHESSKTLRLTYQDKNKNLTEKDAATIREKILTKLKTLKVFPKK